MEKSFVTMEQKVCGVCGHTYDSGALLLDQRMRKQFDMKTTTGMGLCDDCKKKKNAGYIALVVCDPTKSTIDNEGGQATAKFENAYRTGELIHMKKEVAQRMFTGIDVDAHPFIFIDIEAAQKIKRMEEMSRRKQPLRKDEKVVGNKIKRNSDKCYACHGIDGRRQKCMACKGSGYNN